METTTSTKTIDFTEPRELTQKMRELDPFGVDRDVMKLERESLKRAPDPGPPPYCPVCGGRQVAGHPKYPHFGVCVGCASVVSPETRLATDENGKQASMVLPFLRRVSDLDLQPKEIIMLRQQVRAHIDASHR